MSTFKGDFLGFSYNGVHCSELGIFRVSSGDRYQINLSPASKLQTVEVPGTDGTYYFGKSFTQKTFKIDFAFDHVNDEQLRRIKQLLNTKGIHELIFDEEPYKVWDVQINGIPQLKIIPFDEGNVYENFGEIYNTYLTKYGERIYKGEGSIDFICYSPWAHSPKEKKYLSDYPEWKYENKSQWAAASGLPEDNRFVNKDEKIEEYNLIYATSVEDGAGYFYTYNAGDQESPLSLIFLLSNNVQSFNFSIQAENSSQFFKIEGLKLFQGDAGLKIDSKSFLISGIDENKRPTGTVYNRYIREGNIPKVPQGLEKYNFSGAGIDLVKVLPVIEYNYLYY